MTGSKTLRKQIIPMKRKSKSKTPRAELKAMKTRRSNDEVKELQ